jgi:hypothetical protein
MLTLRLPSVWTRKKNQISPCRTRLPTPRSFVVRPSACPAPLCRRHHPLGLSILRHGPLWRAPAAIPCGAPIPRDASVPAAAMPCSSFRCALVRRPGEGGIRASLARPRPSAGAASYGRRTKKHMSRALSFKCFRCFIGTMQIDVAKVDWDVVNVS